MAYIKVKEVSLKLYARNEPIEYIARIVGSTVDQVKERQQILILLPF